MQQIDRVLKFLALRTEVRVIEVNYADVVGQPERTAQHIAEFLGGGMDVGAMVGTVETSLYRNRRG